MAGNPTLPTENIDEVILGLLALEPNEVEELDYDTYKSLLRELLVEVTAAKRKIGDAEFSTVKDEFKRVRGKKGRFRIKKTKITANGLGLGGIRKQVKVAQQRLMLAPVGGVPKQTESISGGKGSDTDVLSRISKTLDSILETLVNINKENKNRIEKERRDAEGRRRQSREKELESKPLEGLKKALSVITKPFQSIWDKIVNFITNIILGRIVLKLIDWFANPENQKKIQSLIRFFKDHWPLLLGLYLRFGTGIGRFVGRLSAFLIKGAIKLGAITARLALKAGLGKAGGRLSKVAGFLGGRGGKLLGAGLAIGTDVALTFGASKAAEGLAGGGADTKVPAFSGGGWNKGFGNVGNFFGKIFNGLVKGPKGRDKVPAMLTDGEFVVSAGAVQKYGVDTFEAMNAAGGGTNVPQIANGMTYAEGGGYIGGVGELRRKYDAIHGAGAYDKESARKKAQYAAEDAAEESRKPRYIESDYVKNLRKRIRPSSRTSKSKPQVPKVSFSPNINIPKTSNPQREADLQARKKARAEYLSIINNPDDPRYQAAWDGKISIDSLKAKYKTTLTPTPAAKPTGTGYTPYQSRFAGARDAAFSRAQGITSSSGPNPYNPMNWFKMGGVFGGPRMQARTDYAASKGKYYSSSDQKTYGNYNDALAAKKSRMTSLESQQRLNRLSSKGAGPKTGRGIRYTTESIARQREWDKRGGMIGGIGRFFQQLGGDAKTLSKVGMADRASEARVKQAGAASIGRYYSSSDGKYYKDYNAAKLARQQRLKSGVKPLPRPKPHASAVAGKGGRSGGGSGAASPSKPPSFSPTHKKGTKTAQAALGVKKK